MGGGDPQEVLNEQLLSGSDILVAIFKSELGPSGGTEREVRFFIEGGQQRRVMLFFHRDAPREPALQGFFDEMKEQVFYGQYSTTGELAERVHRALLERAEKSRASHPLDALRVALIPRIHEWGRLERSALNASEQAFAILDLINTALEQFMEREIGLALGIVDQPVRICAREIRVLIRDQEAFIGHCPWSDADNAIIELIKLLKDLPEEEDLL